MIMKGIYAAFQAHLPDAMRILKEYKAKSVWLWNQCFALVDDLHGNKHIVNIGMLNPPIYSENHCERNVDFVDGKV